MIGGQPRDATSSYNLTASFTVTATAPDSGVLTYQWQISSDNGTNWSNVSTGTGATTNSYTTPNLLGSDSGKRYRVVVTNTQNATTGTTTSNFATLTVNKVAQASLQLTSVAGIYKNPLTLVTSGGTGTGDVTYSINSGNCTLNAGTITGNTLGGTCSVTATKLSDTNYESVSSAPTTITFVRGAMASDLYFSPTPLLVVLYQTTYSLVASATQSSKVTFTANALTIPGCSNIPTKAGTGSQPATATCGFKATTLGVVNLVATLVPDDQINFANTVKTLKITVNPK
jgi:hypothetical protein